MKLGSCDDVEILKLVSEGNRKAFNTLFQKYNNKLRFYIRNFIKEEELIDEILMDVFMAVYNNSSTYQPRYKVSTWMYRIAKNLAIDNIRKRRINLTEEIKNYGTDEEYSVFDNMYNDSDIPYTYLYRKDDCNIIDKILCTLNDTHRKIIELVLYGFTLQEISVRMNMPIGTIKGTIFRIRESINKWKVGE